MQIKECYVSHNGISCITNINSLINLKNINIHPLKTNLLFYMVIRYSEFIITYLIQNKKSVFNVNYFEDILLPSVMFS